jgi:translation initiation factor 1
LDVCKICGLPKDLCVCETIAREGQKLEVTASKRRFGKMMTVITGFSNDVDVTSLSKKLKSKMACGGTAKKDYIELQGDHRKRIKAELVKLGFDESQIEVK